MRTLSLLLLLCGLAAAGTPATVENFTLTDYNGKKVSLNDFKDAKAIVLMFIATECPVSNAYNGRYNALVAEYGARNVAFLGINSNKAEPAEAVKEHAKKHGFSFPILKDEKNVIADRLEAQRTPEIFVLHPATRTVLYHGRIDDSQREEKITSRDLAAALDEILAGKPVSVTETKAFGCTIKRVN
jgi:peroxiredoxin